MVRETEKKNVVQLISSNSFFVGLSREHNHFQRFLSAFYSFPDYKKITLHLCLKAIMLKVPKKSRILLAIDEFRRLGDSYPNVMQEVKLALDSPEYDFRVLISTLDQTLLMQSIKEGTSTSTTSGRSIYWVHLSLIQHKDLYDWPKGKMYEYLITLCNGHPRSLESLARAFDNSINSNITQLLGIVSRALPGTNMNQHRDVEILTLLAQSITGTQVKLNDYVVPGVDNPKTYRYMIETVTLINNVKAIESNSFLDFIPILHPLLLLNWCKSERTIQHIFERVSVQTLVLQLFDYANDLDSKRFEEFLFRYEILRSWAWHYLGKDPIMTIQEWYSGSVVVKGSNPKIVIPKPLLPLDCYTKLDKKFFNVSISKEDLLSQKIFVPVEGNPGFDYVQTVFKFMSPPLDPILKLVECKYSDSESVTTNCCYILCALRDLVSFFI